MADLIVPTVHLNGTAKDVLVQQLFDAVEKLDAAIGAMCQAAPHPRDYYPQDPGNPSAPEPWRKATTAHSRRVAAVDGVRMELRHIAEAIIVSKTHNI